VNEAECVGCNLCVSICPVPECITMRSLQPGEVDRAPASRHRGVRQLDDAPQQPDAPGGASVAEEIPQVVSGQIGSADLARNRLLKPSDRISNG
jgi:Fe-S-cluster-containing hydrogenase component 2